MMWWHHPKSVIVWQKKTKNPHTESGNPKWARRRRLAISSPENQSRHKFISAAAFATNKQRPLWPNFTQRKALAELQLTDEIIFHSPKTGAAPATESCLSPLFLCVAEAHFKHLLVTWHSWDGKMAHRAPLSLLLPAIWTFEGRVHLLGDTSCTLTTGRGCKVSFAHGRFDERKLSGKICRVYSQLSHFSSRWRPLPRVSRLSSIARVEKLRTPSVLTSESLSMKIHR